MESTQITSVHDLIPPILLYVGRVKDPRKGLKVFLSSIEILKTGHSKPFTVWLVGGSNSELAWLKRKIDLSQPLRDMKDTGKLIVWGRVDNVCLPELYSRARATIVPSLREEFGIVAIEAQACGSPVVASKVGGLKDIVLHMETGTLVPPSDSQALAAALTPFLKNAFIARSYGEAGRSWATNNFKQENLYSVFPKIYLGEMEFRTRWESRIIRQDHREEKARQLFSDIFGSVYSAGVFTDLSTSVHQCFSIKTETGLQFGKIFRPKNIAAASRFDLDRTLSSPRSASNLFHSHMIHRHNPKCPQIIDLSEKNTVLVTEWIPDSIIDKSVRNFDQKLNEGIRIFNDYGSKLLNKKMISSYWRELNHLWNSKQFSFEILDNQSAKINKPLFPKDYPIFFRTHPQFELIRAFMLFKSPLYSKSMPDLQMAINEAYFVFCSDQPLFFDQVNLAHGDLKPSHVRLSDGELIFLDPEETHFAVGPLDIGHWAYYRFFRESKEPRPGSEAVEWILKMTTSKNSQILASCWLVSQAIFSGIGRGLNGNLVGSNEVGCFLLEFLEYLPLSRIRE